MHEAVFDPPIGDVVGEFAWSHVALALGLCGLIAVSWGDLGSLLGASRGPSGEQNTGWYKKITNLYKFSNTFITKY